MKPNSKDLLESIQCLCVEGVEFMTRTELAEAILLEIKKHQRSRILENPPDERGWSYDSGVKAPNKK